MGRKRRQKLATDFSVQFLISITLLFDTPTSQFIRRLTSYYLGLERSLVAILDAEPNSTFINQKPYSASLSATPDIFTYGGSTCPVRRVDLDLPGYHKLAH